MELSSVQHIESSNLTDFQPDLFITTLGYESRCTTIARMLEAVNCRKIALSRTDHIRDFAFHRNKAYYQQQGYEMIGVDKKLPDMEQLTRDLGKREIHMLMDCTSMAPRWYFEILRWFADHEDFFSRVTIRIAYTLAQFSGQDPVRKVRWLREVRKAERENKNARTALILGLGHEKSVGDAVFRMVEPDLLYLFYADPPVHKNFVEKVFVHNHALIHEVPIRNLVAYPIRNGQLIYQSLIEVILPLRHDYSVIMVPHGPKIFSLVAMLVHLVYPDIQISHPVFKKPSEDDRQPVEEPVVLDVLFEEDE